ncbi:unnamed protein product, partial [Staurois parvus]
YYSKSVSLHSASFLQKLLEGVQSSVLVLASTLKPYRGHQVVDCLYLPSVCEQGRTGHWGTLALPEGPGSVGGPMRCPWYLS